MITFKGQAAANNVKKKQFKIKFNQPWENDYNTPSLSLTIRYITF